MVRLLIQKRTASEQAQLHKDDLVGKVLALQAQGLELDAPETMWK